MRKSPNQHLVQLLETKVKFSHCLSPLLSQLVKLQQNLHYLLSPDFNLAQMEVKRRRPRKIPLFLILYFRVQVLVLGPHYLPQRMTKNSSKRQPRSRLRLPRSLVLVSIFRSLRLILRVTKVHRPF
jgi:hypothetical protein